MKIKKYIAVFSLLLAAAVFLLSGCSADKTETVTYSKENGAVELSLPENWTYEIDEKGEKSTSEIFSIGIKPENQEGFLDIIYCSYARKVTNERFLNGGEILLGEKSGSTHYGKNKDIWDFIVFDDFTGTYIAYGKDLPWLTAYKDEAEKILTDAVFGKGIMNKAEAIAVALERYNNEYDSVTAKYEPENERWYVTISLIEPYSEAYYYYFVDLQGNIVMESVLNMCG